MRRVIPSPSISTLCRGPAGGFWVIAKVRFTPPLPPRPSSANPYALRGPICTANRYERTSKRRDQRKRLLRSRPQTRFGCCGLKIARSRNPKCSALSHPPLSAPPRTSPCWARSLPPRHSHSPRGAGSSPACSGPLSADRSRLSRQPGCPWCCLQFQCPLADGMGLRVPRWCQLACAPPGGQTRPTAGRLRCTAAPAAQTARFLRARGKPARLEACPKISTPWPGR